MAPQIWSPTRIPTTCQGKLTYWIRPWTNHNLLDLRVTFFLFRYAGYCPKAKFWHYGDTFGNTTAKCFQDRRSAKLNTSVMNNPGISKDGQHKFPTVYCNLPDLVLSARVRTRERWLNAKKCALFNEHERGREVQEFDKVLSIPFLLVALVEGELWAQSSV